MTTPAASSRRAIPPKRLDGWRTGSSSGKRGAQTGERSLSEQRVEGGGERRASLPQLFVTLAQPLIRRQTRQEGGSAAFVELVVDQRDKFGVIIGHDMLAQPSYFSFASAARPAASLLMIVPIGTPSAAAASA